MNTIIILWRYGNEKAIRNRPREINTAGGEGTKGSEQNIMESIRRMKEKAYYFKGFGFHYLSALTNENETIKGGSLFLFGKQCVTIAISDVDWVDDNGKPYKFKLERRVLFVKKWAIGLFVKKENN